MLPALHFHIPLGWFLYTIGQRARLAGQQDAWFVVDKDVSTGDIFVVSELTLFEWLTQAFRDFCCAECDPHLGRAFGFPTGGDKQQLAQHAQLWSILSKLAFGEQRIVSDFGSEIFPNKWQTLKWVSQSAFSFFPLTHKSLLCCYGTVHKMCVLLVYCVLLLSFSSKGSSSHEYSFIILKAEAEYDAVNCWCPNDYLKRWMEFCSSPALLVFLQLFWKLLLLLWYRWDYNGVLLFVYVPGEKWM